MTIPQAALDLIKQSEGCRLTAYADPALGWDVPTIGWGHTSAAGSPKVYRGLKITQTEADQILAADIERVAEQVQALVKTRLTANELGALTSFTYNLGMGNLKTSTLLRKVNANDMAGAAAEFGRWTHSGGKELPGLIKRRAAEAKLFLTQDT